MLLLGGPKCPFCGGPARLGGGGGALRGMVPVTTLLGGFGLGERGDGGIFLSAARLPPEPDEVSPRFGGGGGKPPARVGGGGGGPPPILVLLLLPEGAMERVGGGGGGAPTLVFDGELKRLAELDIFLPTPDEDEDEEEGGGAGVERVGGGGGGTPPRDDASADPPPRTEPPRLGGGGGGPFLVGGGGPARFGGGGGFEPRLIPGPGRGNCGGLGPFVVGGDEDLFPNLLLGGGPLLPGGLLKPRNVEYVGIV